MAAFQAVTGATGDVVRLSRAAAADIPVHTLEVVKLCLLDFFGLAIAGSTEPVISILRDAARAEGSIPAATMLGSAARGSLRQATLINATAGHALDYDDVALAMHVHPTTVILPPLLALAERHGIGGRAVLEAFVAGYEGAGMVGAWLGAGPYDRGFHMTGTVGAIGAAIGAAHLLGLDDEARARAIGLAATQAAGLKAQFGTMAKPLHAGRAAETGLLAALWAQAGMTGRLDILEARQGFAATQSSIPDGPIRWAGYQLDDNSFKYHAACFGVHGTINAIAALRAGGLRPQDIRILRVLVDAGADRMCNIPAPRTGSEARFSLRFAAALALHGWNTTDPAIFCDEATADPALDRTRAMTEVVLQEQGWPDEVTEVVVETIDGRRLSARCDMTQRPPLAEAAISIRRKFDTLVSPLLPSEAIERLAIGISNFDRVSSLGEMLALCVGEGRNAVH